MIVKIASVTDKKDGHTTQGHKSVGKKGAAMLRCGKLMILIQGEGMMRTSDVDKITVETKNSVYELEVEKGQEEKIPFFEPEVANE